MIVEMSTETPELSEPEEPRNETLSLSLSASEKWLMELMKRKTGKSYSLLLRDHSLTELVAMGKKLDRAIDDAVSLPV